MEQRTMHMRELSLDVTQQGLHHFLMAQGSPALKSPDIIRREKIKRCHAFVTFATTEQAREAVRKLHNRHFMGQTLGVGLAQDPTPVDVQRPIIADGSV